MLLLVVKLEVVASLKIAIHSIVVRFPESNFEFVMIILEVTCDCLRYLCSRELIVPWLRISVPILIAPTGA